MSTSKKSLAVVWNTGAGWDEGEREAELVKRILSEVDPELRFEQVKRGDKFGRICRDCVTDGADVLVASGGDGTINAVAAAAVETGKTLGVIPAGTLNHFARDLEISLEPGTAAEQLRDGREILVDVGTVNGRIFINNSVLGLYPVYRTARKSMESYGLGTSRIGRFFAVLGGILQVFWRLPHVTLRFKMDDGQNKTLKTAFVLVANNEHELETWRIGHRRAMNEGYLWVYVLRKSTRWAMLRHFAKFLFKQFSRQEAFRVFRVRALQIESRHKTIRVGVDGEVIRMQSPLEYESLPKALKVIAPSTYKIEPRSEPQFATEES